MKRRTFLGAIGALLAVPFVTLRRAVARPANFMTYPQMNEKADLIVIAHPQSTKAVGTAFNYFGYEVVGVETTCAVVVIFKDKRTKVGPTFNLYHLQLVKPDQPVANGPMLLNFDLKNKAQYLMFLRDTGEARFEPITGQMDADPSVEKLRVPAN